MGTEGNDVSGGWAAVSFVFGAAIVGLAAWFYGLIYCGAEGFFSTCPLSLVEYQTRDLLVVAGGLCLAAGVGFLVCANLANRAVRPRGTAPAIRSPGELPPLPMAQRAKVVGISLGVAAALLAMLVLVPVPQPFTMHGAAIPDLQTSCPGIDTVQGSILSFHWTTPAPTYFFVVSCSAGQVAYQANGTSGSDTFVSVGGVYDFGAACPGPVACVSADVWGTYTAPILPV